MNSNSFKSKKSYLEGVEKALLAAQSYYHGSSILMDDASYDDLLLALIATEASNPEWVSEKSPVGKVAAGLNNSSANVTHTVPMLSLDNVFSKDELESWDVKLEKVLGKKASSYVVEPKLDGLAISVTYRNGEITQALTRGDGANWRRCYHAGKTRYPWIATQIE